MLCLSTAGCSSSQGALPNVSPPRVPPLNQIRPAKVCNGFNDDRSVRSFNSITRQAKNPNFTGMHQQARLGFRRKKLTNGVRLRPLEGEILMPTSSLGDFETKNVDVMPQVLMPSLPKLPSPTRLIADPYAALPVGVIVPMSEAMPDPNADLPLGVIVPTRKPMSDPNSDLPVGVIVPMITPKAESSSGMPMNVDQMLTKVEKELAVSSLPVVEEEPAPKVSEIPLGQGIVMVENEEALKEAMEEAKRTEAKAKARAAGIEARKRAEAAMAEKKKVDKQAVDTISVSTVKDLKSLRARFAMALVDATRNHQLEAALGSTKTDSSLLDVDATRQKAAEALYLAGLSDKLAEAVADSTRTVAIKQSLAQSLVSLARSGELSQTLSDATKSSCGTPCDSHEQVQRCKAKAKDLLKEALGNGTLDTSVEKAFCSDTVCKPLTPVLREDCKKEKIRLIATTPTTPKSAKSSRPGSIRRSFRRPDAPPSPLLD